VRFLVWCHALVHEVESVSGAARLGTHARIHRAPVRSGRHEGARLARLWGWLACPRGFRVAGESSGAALGRYEVSPILSTSPRCPRACGQGEAGRALARAAGEWVVLVTWRGKEGGLGVGDGVERKRGRAAQIFCKIGLGCSSPPKAQNKTDTVATRGGRPVGRGGAGMVREVGLV
jgi:hypothetical protein